ncbi:hypothetical protein [Paracoccus siganidrum]|nr:hypothetical protein [Paracoccus siganidrum]
MKWMAILAVIAVAACGVDGPPQRPAAQQQPNVSISGHATVGVITEL